MTNQPNAKISSFLVEENLSVSQSLDVDTATAITLTNMTMYSTLMIAYGVECAEHFFGADCNTFCNEELGNYICDTSGSKVCSVGYQNPSSSCTECVPREGCCEDCTSTRRMGRVQRSTVLLQQRMQT